MSLVKAFSKMLDSIPHDQMFTQMVLSQIVTYYDKCCGWYKGMFVLVCRILMRILTVIAMVTRISSPVNGGTRLKKPALFADAGEIHETVKKLLVGNGDRKALIDKVGLHTKFIKKESANN